MNRRQGAAARLGHRSTPSAGETRLALGRRRRLARPDASEPDASEPDASEPMTRGQAPRLSAPSFRIVRWKARSHIRPPRRLSRGGDE
jgi:hypothetical protein